MSTPTNQEKVLLTLIQGSEGKAWAENIQGWKKGGNNDGVCYWFGIECDEVDRITVVGINLPSADFSGTLPSELGQLKTLRTLSLQENIIRGTIPPEIAALPHLEVINLGDNNIEGTIPAFSSPLLRSFCLANNNIVGTLPHDIGDRHERLYDFDVMGNKITGPIPDSFSQMTGLDTLSLSENKFSGTIPAALGDVPKLRYLYMDSNSLVGTIPPLLARLDSPLAELWLQKNMLSGTVPAVFADLKDLFNFYIDGNKLTGTIPVELCRQEINADFFANVPTGSSPDTCQHIACPEGHIAVEGMYPCQECHDRFFNPYLGQETKCIDLNERDILQTLFDVTNGAGWTNIPNKWDRENDFYCGFTGITCDNNKHVIGINLKGKNLIGHIPEEIGYLRFLENLDLSDNQLTGFLPSDFRWAPLETLDVSGNKLRGIVPPMLCERPDINGNGANGEYSCDHIACGPGTYSSTGHASAAADGEQCKPCIYASNILASKACNKPSVPTQTYASSGSASASASSASEKSGAYYFFMIVISLVLIFFVGYVIMKIRKGIVKRSRGHRRMSIPQTDQGEYA